MTKAGDGQAGEKLCCKAGQQSKQESAVPPSILGCINRPVIIGWLEGWSTTPRQGLRKWGLSSLEKRELSEDLTAACQYLWGDRPEDRAMAFIAVHGGRVSDNTIN